MIVNDTRSIRLLRSLPLVNLNAGMHTLGILSALFALCTSELGLSDLSRNKRQLNDADVTVEFRDLTKRSPDPHPDQLHLEIRSPDGQIENLVLKRNVHFSTNFPVTTSENGLKKRHAIDKSNEALYLSERAAFHVSSELENDDYKRSVESGFFIQRGEKRFIEKRANGEHSMITPPISPHKIEEGQVLNDVLKPPHQRGAFGASRKYPVGKDLYVDVLMVVDYGIYVRMGEKFSHLSPHEKESETVKRIREYYGLVGAGIAHKYEQVDYDGMTIKPRIAEILITKTERDDRMLLGMNKGDDDIHGNPAVAQVSHWSQSQKRKGHYKTIDHVMAFTSHKIYSLEGEKKFFGTVGLAFKGYVCQYWQGSLNEDDFSMAIIGIAAHELGHNLGAPHDFDDCSDSYIMSAFVTHGDDHNFMNQYRFSDCSLRSFHAVMTDLNSKQANCMTDRPAIDAATSGLVTEAKPGMDYTMDQQCQMFTRRDDAYYCGPKEGVCRKLPCESGFGCFPHDKKMALYGTPCGPGKECRFGMCLKIR